MTRCFSLLPTAACLFLVSVSGAYAAQHDSAAPADPSGTWRWQDPEGITGGTNQLRLNLQKNGKVAGRFNGYGNKRVAIKNGRLEGNKLTFQIDLEIDGARIHADATATIQGDEMKIVAKYSGDEGPGTSTATAKRSVRPGDVVGQWKLTFETPDGYLLQPTLAITREKQKLKATYTSKDGQTDPVKSVELKENQLTVQMQTVHLGAPVDVKLVGRAYGRKMKGILHYDYEGEVGEIPFNAQKNVPKKKKRAAG
jgi:hypothetical protein